MSKITCPLTLTITDLIATDMAGALKAAATVRAETGGVRRATYINRLRQGVVAIQLHRLGADQYVIAEATGQGVKAVRGVVKPNTTYVRHLIAIGALLLLGVDANGEDADLVRTFANTERHTGKAYAAEKAYVIGAKPDTFDKAHLVTLMGGATVSDLDREDDTLAALIAKVAKVKGESADTGSEGEGDAEGEGESTDTPTTTDEDVLRMIATIGEITAANPHLDRAAIIRALGSLATSLFNTAPAIVEHAA